MQQQIIQNTEKFVKNLLMHEGTGHDWWHAVRVSSAAKDIQKAPQHVMPLNSELYQRIQSLVSGVEFDLDAPLDDKDE